MKRLLLLVTAVWLMAFGAMAQGTKDCRGVVTDANGEPVIGATLQVPGTQVGTITDIDGKFTIKVPANAKELKISAVGYKGKTLKPEAQLGTVVLEIEATMLQDVVVTQSVAKTRQTPVAISEVSAGQIDIKLGNQEFPEVLKTTPGVWAT